MSLKITYKKGQSGASPVKQEMTGSGPHAGVNVSDQQIWQEFKKGEDTAYAFIYKNHAQDLYSYGTSIANDSAFVKDCIHDLFLDLWQRRKKLADVSSIRLYLFKALRNKILKEKAKRKPLRAEVEDNYNFQFEYSSESLMIHNQFSEERRKKLRLALESLTQRQREAIFLKFYKKLSYKEVAAVVGITQKATYKLLARSIQMLRNKMISIILLFLTIFS
ncbi:sigma-70 family RNA polymerase sigma factor [Fulvivirgaceae bacterium BMA12]|uniref:Sigma-70 family RNA polymerase sigma factor n=1 Tax=Agaribacillus aureus TaxID=3051825 RepID=A0ABT8L5Z7_9BACT|nr:sigma-70 family RNA polymerase sigma factor [Fulvivirgaceae bacterium BMA12]